MHIFYFIFMTTMRGKLEKILLSLLPRQETLVGDREGVKWLPNYAWEIREAGASIQTLPCILQAFLHHLSLFCKLLVKHFSDVLQWLNRTNIYSSPRKQQLFKISDMKSCPKRLRLCKLFHSWCNFILKIFSGHGSSSKWRKNTLEEDKTFSVKSVIFF